MRRYEGIALKELIKHKKRTIFTLLSIIFSLAILILVGQINDLNYRNEMISIKYSYGDSHGKFRNISGEEAVKLENNSLIEKVGYSYRDSKVTRVDYPEGGYKETTEEIFYADKKYFENILEEEFFKVEGRIPNSEEEVIVVNPDSEFKEKIGGKTIVNGKERTVVGFLKTIQNEGFMHIKILGISDAEKFKKLNANIQLVEEKNIQESFEKIGQDIGAVEYLDKTSQEEIPKDKKLIDLNIERIKLIGEKVQVGRNIYYPNKIDNILQVILIISLIILTYISVNASVKEKRKTYSMLKCIGASNGQIRNLILRDGFIIAVVSIIPGIILGEAIFLGIRDNLLNLIKEVNVSLAHELNLKIIIISIISTFIVILFASLVPMIWVGFLSPIESLREKKIKGNKKPIKSKFIRKLCGYECELAYKNLKANKSSFIGLTVTMIVVLVIFNIFTNYYKHDIDILKKQMGAMAKDITVRSSDEENIEEIFESYKEYGNYARMESYMPLIRIEGIDREIIKDSQCYNYYDKDKNIITSRGYGPSIYILNDKAFNDLKPYANGENLSLEKFKDNGAIFFTNNEEGAIYPPKKENKVKVYINDGEVDKFEDFWGPDSEIGKFKVPDDAKTTELELNIIGTTSLETLISDRMGFGGRLSGLIISEDTAKGLKLESTYETGSTYIYEFKNKELREKHLSKLDREITSEVRKNIWESMFINTAQETEDNNKFLNSYALVMYSILGFIVIMLVLGVVNIRDIVLNARKKEFGTMFAVGMDKGMLRRSLIYEGLIQGVIALIIGNAITIILIKIIALNMKSFVIIPEIMVIGSLGVVLVCILNIINSIRRLSNKEAIELIREID